jgi:hypothetical protein
MERTIASGARSQPTTEAKPGTLRQLLLAPQITIAILFVLVAVGALLRLQHIADVGYRTPDERVYIHDAQRIAQRGPGEFSALVREYNADRTLWVFPPPWRIAYLVTLAEAVKISGVADERAGAWLSYLVSVASLALLSVIGARFLPASAAIYAVLCLATSPLDLTIARRCWSDSLLGGLGLLLVWSACEITRNPRNWWNYAALVITGSCSILVKEFGLVIYGACAVYALLLLVRQKSWRAIAGFSLGAIVGAALCLYCLVSATGGLHELQVASQHQATGFADPWGRYYQGGPWSQFIWGLWIISPMNLVLALFAVGLSILSKRQWALLALPFPQTNIYLLRLFSGLTVLLVLTLLVLPMGQNFRYLSPVYGPMYVLGGIGLWAFLHLAARRMQGLRYQALLVLTMMVVVVSAVAGYLDFERVYVKRGVSDLSIKLVLDSRR